MHLNPPQLPQTPAEYAAKILLSSPRKPTYVTSVEPLDENVIKVTFDNFRNKRLQGYIAVTRTKKKYRYLRSRNSRDRTTILVLETQRPAHTMNSLLKVCKRFRQQEWMRGKKIRTCNSITQTTDTIILYENS